MQKDLKVRKGESIENAITIDSPNSILGVMEEHAYLDQLFSSLDNEIRSVEQNLIIEDQKQYDKFVIKMNDGTQRVIFFHVSSFF